MAPPYLICHVLAKFYITYLITYHLHAGIFLPNGTTLPGVPSCRAYIVVQDGNTSSCAGKREVCLPACLSVSIRLTVRPSVEPVCVG
jgi:hypothetical protein